MELISGIITGLLVLVFLVVIHELGHAIVARRNGVVVEEFGIGFPPRAWARKLKNGVLLSLNWLPLGGFVKLQGEHDAASKKGDYGAATYWQKTKILLAGVAINWLAAAFILTILAWVGLPRVLTDQFSVAGDTTIVPQPVEVTMVTQGSPADKAGIKPGDAIVRFDGQSMTSSQAFSAATKQRQGQAVDLTYRRKGQETTVRTTLNTDAESTGKGYLGVASTQREYLRATWSAPIVGVATTAQFTGETLRGLGDVVVSLVKGVVMQLSPDETTRRDAQHNLETVKGSVAGPVGILGTIFPAAEQAGPIRLAFLTALISLTLAVMNILPIPALDGGRWFVMTIFRLLKKPLTKAREEQIQSTGFIALMVLVVMVTIADVSKLFQ